MPDTPIPALMFAAGFGTRMKHLTVDRPKPLIEVAGKPLVDHALDLLTQAGCAPIVANLHYKPDMLAQHLTPRGVTTIVEAPKILETGGGLINALPVLGTGPVVTTNTDAIWKGPNPVTLLQDAWRPEVMDALLICLRREDAVGHGGTGDFLMTRDGQLTRGPGMVYGGVQIIKTDGIVGQFAGAFSLNLVWDRMLAEGRLYGLPYPGKWCDVGHPGGIALAEALLDEPDV